MNHTRQVYVKEELEVEDGTSQRLKDAVSWTVLAGESTCTPQQQAHGCREGFGETTHSPCARARPCKCHFPQDSTIVYATAHIEAGSLGQKRRRYPFHCMLVAVYRVILRGLPDST